MELYKVTHEERLAFEALNAKSTDGNLVIVCDTEEHGCVVCLDGIDKPEFSEHKKLLPTTLDAQQRVTL